MRYKYFKRIYIVNIMNNLIISNDYIDRVINDLKGQQKLTLDTIGRIDEEELEKNNKYVSLLSDAISIMIKLKQFKKPKEETKKKMAT